MWNARTQQNSTDRKLVKKQTAIKSFQSLSTLCVDVCVCVSVCVWGLDGNRRKIKKNKILMTFRDLGETKQEKKSLEKIQPHLLWFVFVVVVVVTDHLLPLLLVSFCKRLKWAVFFFLSLHYVYIYFDCCMILLCVFFSRFSLFFICMYVSVFFIFLHSLFAGAVSSVCLFGCMCVLCLHKSKKCFCVYVFHRFAYMLLLFNFIQLIKNNLNKNNKIKT